MSVKFIMPDYTGLHCSIYRLAAIRHNFVVCYVRLLVTRKTSERVNEKTRVERTGPTIFRFALISLTRAWKPDENLFVECIAFHVNGFPRKSETVHITCHGAKALGYIVKREQTRDDKLPDPGNYDDNAMKKKHTHTQLAHNEE